MPRRRSVPCVLYVAGHHTHWVHSKLSAENMGQVLDGTVNSIAHDGLIEFQCPSASFLLWHHEPQRLRRMSGDGAQPARLICDWHLLQTKSDGGWYCFNVLDMVVYQTREIEGIERHGGPRGGGPHKTQPIVDAVVESE